MRRCPVISTQKPHRHVLLILGGVAGACLGLLTGCGDKQADHDVQTVSPLESFADSQPPPADAGIMLHSTIHELPPGVVSTLAALMEKERAWLVKPPSELTPEQLDQQFAELRWEISQLIDMHDVAGAISYARSSLELDVMHPARWERLGDLHQVSGAMDAARQAATAYDNAVFLAPQSKAARQKLIAALLMLQRPRDALIHLEAGLFLVDETEERTLVPVYAASCAAAGEFKRGIAFLRALAEAEGGTPQHRVAWAVLENAGGSRDHALKLLAEVQTNADPSSPLARYAATLQKRYEKTAKGAAQ